MNLFLKILQNKACFPGINQFSEKTNKTFHLSPMIFLHFAINEVINKEVETKTRLRLIKVCNKREIIMKGKILSSLLIGNEY